MNKPRNAPIQVTILGQAIKPILPLTLLLLSSSPEQHRGLGVPRHAGCPGNALCSQEAGKLRQKWKEVLFRSRNNPKRTLQLEGFRLRYGIPLESWTLPEKKPPTGAHFDSPCPGSPWMLSEIFAPDMNKLPKKTFPRQGYLLRGKKIEALILPRGDVPLYEQKKRLYYNREFEGEYYGISIGINGDIRMEKPVTPLKPYEYPQVTACPQKLLEQFTKNNHISRPDSAPRCLKLPGTGKESLILLLGNECGQR